LGSGKGGVGKSILSVLLGASLAAQATGSCCSMRTTISANLHVLPRHSGQPRASRRCSRANLGPRTLIRPVGERLWLLPGDSGTEALHDLEPFDRARLQHRLSSVYDQFDVVIVDAAAGIDGVVRTATMRSTTQRWPSVTEPTALTDASAPMKS